MGLIDIIKKYKKHRELKKLSDEEIEEKVEDVLEEEKQEIPNLIDHITDEEKKLEVVKEVLKSEQLPKNIKAEAVEALPHSKKVRLFKENKNVKKILAQEDIDTFTKILVDEKTLKPYDELYNRLGDAFSDSQVSNILNTLNRTRPEAYEEEKVLSIVAKQIVTDIKKHGTFFASHLHELESEISIQDKNEKRKFDILKKEDADRLYKKMLEESEIIIERDSSDSNRLSSQCIKREMSNMINFTRKSNEEKAVSVEK